MRSGKVYLIGAGPGAEDLITLRAVRILNQAEVVLYDRLVDQGCFSHIHPDALKIDVGRNKAEPSDQRQNRIHDLILGFYRQGKIVVRLKGGDPFVFGRGGEELLALCQEGVSAEVVPGVSSCIAAPGAASIPLTLRGTSSSFGVFTGHPAEGKEQAGFDWDCAARMETAVFLMGVKKLPEIVAQLLAHGREASTPVALIERASLSGQKVVAATLATIEDRAIGIQAPATLVVGDVVKVHHAIASLESRPEIFQGLACVS